MGVVSTGSITLYDYNDQKSVNILDSSTWTVGNSGSQPGFRAMGTAPSTENIIELGIDPFGRSSPLWKMTADIAVPHDSDGGWHTDYFDVSDIKTYRFVNYVKRDTFDGITYLGLFSNGSVHAVTLAGVDNSNPYFWNGIPPLLNRWYVIIGYVHPKDTTITTSIGGVYDTVTGKKVFNGTDFKWKPGTTKALHRAYYYYCTTAGSVQYFWGPRVEVCDGSEMPLEQLLLSSASDYQLTQMASDGIITPQEKVSFLSRWCEIVNDSNRISTLPTGPTDTIADGEFKTLRTQAVAVNKWTPTTAGTPAKAYYDACEALRAYLFTTPGVILISTWSQNIPIDKTTFLTRWTTASSAGEDFRKAIIVAQTIYQYSVDGSTNWHTTWATGDLYMRVSTDNGATWGPAMRIVGENGQSGQYTDFKFAKNTSPTTAPSYTANADNPGANWYDAPQTLGTGEYQWMIQSDWRSTTRLTNWTAPVRISGEQGQQGVPGANGTRTASIELYQWASAAPTTFPSGTSTYTWATGAFTDPATLNGWTHVPGIGAAGQTLYGCRQIYSDTGTSATSTITWAATICYPLGAAGANGTRTAVLEVYQWAASTPTTFPSGTSTYTWATGVFTAPSTPNGWSINPTAAVPGQTLWACQVIYTDSDTSTTDTVTWNTSTAYAVGGAGTNGQNAIVMTSPTTPAGTYVGQLGIYNGVFYQWDGSSWVSVNLAVCRCLGLYPYSEISSVSGMLPNDVIVVYSTDALERGVYVYSNAAWVKENVPSTDEIAKCFPFILTAISTATTGRSDSIGNALTVAYGVSADYVPNSTNFETLMVNFLYANVAYITNLLGQNITLPANGYIKSNNYAEDAEGYPTAGFDIDAAGNIVKSYGSRFTESVIKNAYFTGEIDTEVLKTYQHYSIAARSWTSGVDTRAGVYLHFSSLISDYLYQFNTTFSYNGYTVKYAKKTRVILNNVLRLYDSSENLIASFTQGSSDTISVSFTSSAISLTPKVHITKLEYDALDHFPANLPTMNTDTSVTLASADIGTIKFYGLNVTKANTTYTIKLPSGGAYYYLAYSSGTYYSSTNELAGHVSAGYGSGGAEIFSVNKGGSGQSPTFVIYWRVS